MKNLFAIALAFVCLGIPASATSTVPFRPRSITVDFAMGRKATFTFEPSKMEQEQQRTKEDRRKDAFSFRASKDLKSGQGVRSPWDPGTKIVKVEFTFSNGTRAEVPEADVRDIDLIGITDCEIETLVREGSWALSIRIKNLRALPARNADDRVVFYFEDYKYSKRRLEIDYKRNANK